MKNSRLFFQLILSRGVGVPFPIMSTFYIISMNIFLERKTGLEPATFSLEGWRSSQLSYFRKFKQLQPYSKLGMNVITIYRI